MITSVLQPGFSTFYLPIFISIGTGKTKSQQLVRRFFWRHSSDFINSLPVESDQTREKNSTIQCLPSAGGSFSADDWASVLRCLRALRTCFDVSMCRLKSVTWAFNFTWQKRHWAFSELPGTGAIQSETDIAANNHTW